MATVFEPIFGGCEGFIKLGSRLELPLKRKIYKIPFGGDYLDTA